MRSIAKSKCQYVKITSIHLSNDQIMQVINEYPDSIALASIILNIRETTFKVYTWVHSLINKNVTLEMLAEKGKYFIPFS